jgi:two-component system cell cycle sensor histidine kinase/response regulator CckA
MPSNSGSETIVIVDDEATVLSLTGLMLGRQGYKAIAAPSAKEALRLFEAEPRLEVDLLMVDIVMPEMNGIELASRVQTIRPGLPVLFFSAYSEQEILRPVIARNIPFIAKPFTSLQLTKKIRDLLDTAKVKTAGSAEQD